jgi:Uma2 family endonuclease
MTTTRIPSAAWLDHAIINLVRGEFVYATGVPWAEYERLLLVRDQNRRRGVRITYDRGRIELETRSLDYEPRAYRLKRMVHYLVEGLDVPILNAGPVSLATRDVYRGREPDECLYVSDATSVLARTEDDRASMPPPDLVVRVVWPDEPLADESAYARWGVPEIWKHDDGTVQILGLRPDQSYAPSVNSTVFPEVTASDLTRALREAQCMGDLGAMRRLRAWAAKHIGSDLPMTNDLF